MAGQWLVFWCTIAGLVVIACTEAVRYHRRDPRPGLGPTPQHRLHTELDRQPGGADESPL